MDQAEIRLRLVEAAAKNPIPHRDGFSMGVLEQAKLWETWVLEKTGASGPAKGTLTLPRKS